MKKRSKNILWMAMSMNLLMITLTACASKEMEEAKVAEVLTEESVVEEEVAGVETAVDEVAESTAEATLEPTEEPMSEPVVYEGIDMESPFPEAEWGSQEGEWVGTFYGIINEPKFVVTNVETNKKIIVEEGQKVVLEEGDALGVYLCGGIIAGMRGIPDVETEIGFGNTYQKFKLGIITKDTEFQVDIGTLEGVKTVSCILVPND